MKEKISAGISIVLFVALMASLFFNYKQYSAKDMKPVTVETSVKWHETATERPQSTAEAEVGKLTAEVAKASVKPRKKADVCSKSDTTVVLPCADTIQVELPKTQKVYVDSSYVAYVSGYQPNLDSIRVRFPTITTTITQTKEVKKFRRWNVGVIGGYGYGIKSKSVEPFIGIGVTVSLF